MIAAPGTQPNPRISCDPYPDLSVLGLSCPPQAPSAPIEATVCYLCPQVQSLSLGAEVCDLLLLWPSRLFGLDIKGRDCGDEVARWFTSFLKTEAYRLVQYETSMKGRTSKEIFSNAPDFGYQVSRASASTCSVSPGTQDGGLGVCRGSGMERSGWVWRS